ncbi:unnamed protein product [Paramecium pentaurelia]|uniref:Calponin-homology (CH) domain-containing protein n=1 Tax=Paramecium pentaurelia TaxID=43138 RepID=A0A8S1TEY1_9CILI|nr:unnamed protein product [Paramecium pentaurelia]
MDNLKQIQALKVEKGDGFHHTYSQDEVSSFCDHINYYLKDDKDVADILPLDPETNDMFVKVGDGILLCKIINLAQNGAIDPRAINVKKPLNIFNENINLNLAIQSAKSIGCIVVNIRPDLIKDRREHIILGLVWQIIKIQTTKMVNLKENPFLIRLKKEDEEIGDILKLPPDQLLLRWFNHHLKEAKSQRQVNNFDKDLQDGEAYIILLNQLDKDRCSLDGLTQDQENRAKTIIQNAETIGVPKFMRPVHIVKGNSKLNLLFCAQIFNTCPGLTPSQDDYEKTKMLQEDDDPESSMDERVFKMWINSLNIEDGYINNLIEDMRDGINLNRLLEKLKPQTINWKNVKIPAKSRIIKVQNANYSLEQAKTFKITLVNVGGVDFVDGKKKLILGVIWQLFRLDVLKTMGDQKDDQILEAANKKVPEADRLASFKDPKAKTSHFFFRILNSIEPRAIDWDFVQKGETPEEIESNAKYVISVARRLGATVFLIWEQIRDGKAKMLAVFTASLLHFAEDYKVAKLGHAE